MGPLYFIDEKAPSFIHYRVSDSLIPEASLRLRVCFGAHLKRFSDFKGCFAEYSALRALTTARKLAPPFPFFLNLSEFGVSEKKERKMAVLEVVDHSRHRDASPLVSTASNLVLIDNYDSFTWNVYQYLVLEGANVTVYRNDKVTIEELIDKNPTQLVISPGPGHPGTDSGISRDAIKHFAGKIPIFGVCMGQ